jgi:hypothetical protein
VFKTLLGDRGASHEVKAAEHFPHHPGMAGLGGADSLPAIAGHFGSGDPDPLPIPFALDFHFSQALHGGVETFIGVLAPS